MMPSVPAPLPVPDRVVVISDFSRERGGASRLAALLARRLAARGVPVTVFAGDLPVDVVPEDAMLPGIAVTGIPGRALLEQRRAAALRVGLWNGQARRALAQLIAAQDTPGTIYHVHGFHQTLSPAIFAALHPVRARVVIHAHDYFLACPNGAFFDYRARTECARRPMSAACITCNCDKRSPAQKAWRLARQAVQNRHVADILEEGRVILIHEDMQPYLERGLRIAHPVTLRNPAEPFLQGSITPATQQTFLYVGDVHAYKGVFDLAEAARRGAIPLMIAGTGQDMAELQKRYPEVKFCGWQDRAGLARLAATARAVVVPTLGPEPFGLTLVEALTSGLPVIVSDRALLAREIAASGAGLTFRAGDAGDLGRVLARVAGDDDLVSAMSLAALRARSRHDMSPDQWCDGIMAVYRAALAPDAADAALVSPD